jgi:hypothetical protein
VPKQTFGNLKRPRKVVIFEPLFPDWLVVDERLRKMRSARKCPVTAWRPVANRSKTQLRTTRA